MTNLPILSSYPSFKHFATFDFLIKMKLVPKVVYINATKMFVCLFSTDTLEGENVPYVPLPLRRRGIIQLRKRTKA